MSRYQLVALRKESVDRNLVAEDCDLRFVVSLSARRAWIEMKMFLTDSIASLVALRKESVDRNPYIPLAKVRHCESLSARRAWIEISTQCKL